ncbi:MAG TPA: SMP-30/gluconolactonase/LRE family protein [Bryobacteraceae bacterium]|nr:SMP-30/gluconolactonase/LRE family protein [Bryobacteraceae bacterium]
MLRRVSRLPLFFVAVFSSAQDFSQIRIEQAAKDLRYAEGPVWSPEGFLLFSDTVANKIYKLAPGQRLAEYASIPAGPAGNAIDAQGRLYTCEFRERRLVRTSKNGKMEVLASRYQSKRLNAPNDVAVRHDGQIYFTDPAFGNQQDTRELDFYGVFHLTPHGDLEPIARLQTRPNGIALSPNGRILYVSDSDARVIRAWDLDRAGAAANPRMFAEKIPGVPDGLRTDEKGNVYVAAKEIYVYNPQGEPIGHLQLPETPTNLAFGEADRQTLFVTTRTGVYRIQFGKQ